MEFFTNELLHSTLLEQFVWCSCAAKFGKQHFVYTINYWSCVHKMFPVYIWDTGRMVLQSAIHVKDSTIPQQKWHFGVNKIGLSPDQIIKSNCSVDWSIHISEGTSSIISVTLCQGGILSHNGVYFFSNSLSQKVYLFSNSLSQKGCFFRNLLNSCTREENSQ